MYSFRTDLASELRDDAMKRYAKDNEGEPDGIEYNERDEGFGISVSEIKIKTENGVKTLGKPVGTYITISFPTAANIDIAGFKRLCGVTANEIYNVCKLVSPCARSLIFCGIGNRQLSVDAIGPMAADKVLVTHHLKKHDRELFEKSGLFDIMALTPGITEQTGTESGELIKSMVTSEKPELCIVTDALCARSPERLARTIQISSSGISPGAGVGNRHGEINEGYMGIPVVAIGTPTVIEALTLVTDESGNINADEKTAEKLRGLFVSPKEMDSISKNIGAIIGCAVNTAFHRGIPFEEILIL